MSDLDESSDPSGDPPAAPAEGPVRPSGPEPTIAAEHYRATLGHFCTGVTVVTAAGADGPAGFTCQSFSALSLDPPLVLICPGKASSSWPRIAAAGHFCVNVLAEDQEELCRDFASRTEDKFTGVGWQPGVWTGAPVLAGALASIECRLEAVREGGDHFVAIGRVLELSSRSGRPLLFFRGGYGRFDV